jgi:hypothetical protein
MAHDGEYFRRRAAQARAAAICRGETEESEIAGQLALAYAALARRHGAASNEPEPIPSEIAEA